MNLKDINANYPKWLPTNTQYLCYMGSFAYGVSTDASDMDVCGFCMPPKEYIYPDDYIIGFDNPPVFGEWIQHHVKHKEKEYDFTVYNIVKYFKLSMECNPNMVDSLFVPLNCIAKITQVGNLVRENRHLFLCKKAWHSFKCYAYAEITASTKVKNNPEIAAIRQFEEEHGIPHDTEISQIREKAHNLSDSDYYKYLDMFSRGMAASKRFYSRKRYGYDLKNLYHVVRLLSQVEQILSEHDLVLDEGGRKRHMMAIRNGEIPLDDIIAWAKSKEKDLETLYVNSTLPAKMRTAEIRALLKQCLDINYGGKTKVSDSEYKLVFDQIKELIEGIS